MAATDHPCSNRLQPTSTEFSRLKPTPPVFRNSNALFGRFCVNESVSGLTPAAPNAAKSGLGTGLGISVPLCLIAASTLIWTASPRHAAQAAPFAVQDAPATPPQPAPTDAERIRELEARIQELEARLKEAEADLVAAK